MQNEAVQLEGTVASSPNSGGTWTSSASSTSTDERTKKTAVLVTRTRLSAKIKHFADVEEYTSATSTDSVVRVFTPLKRYVYKCKKLYSLKHLVRTTVAGSHY